MSDIPIAYHITFGTYGCRLHGDPRGTVDRQHNQYLEPILSEDRQRELENQERLRFPPITLTAEQRIFIENVTPQICVRGGWTLHAVAAGPDHVHVCLTGDAEGKRIRNWFKRWLGEALSEKWPLLPEQTWWAEDGSVKWIFDEANFKNVVSYITKQRTTVT
ncbi:MAG TPA: hypothetical protein VM165_10220 [Planctomycetaceae bacterium]|nr:hypothetical protein [Planctomycetaceae bacterium]